MPNITLNLFSLGCHSRSDIILRRDAMDSSIAFIKFAGHTYSADWDNFRILNFECPLTLIV